MTERKQIRYTDLLHAIKPRLVHKVLAELGYVKCTVCREKLEG